VLAKIAELDLRWRRHYVFLGISMDYIIGETIRFLANLALGATNFERITASVDRWAEMELTGAEKRHGVLAELNVIGIQLSERLARLGIELAVELLNRAAK